MRLPKVQLTFVEMCVLAVGLGMVGGVIWVKLFDLTTWGAMWFNTGVWLIACLFIERCEYDEPEVEEVEAHRDDILPEDR